MIRDSGLGTRDSGLLRDSGRAVTCRLPSPVSRLPRNTGFTLIEILAAFVVFALAFGAVMHALTGSLHNTVRAGNYTEAALLARSKMAALGVTVPLKPGATQGEFGNGYRWRMQIREAEKPKVTGGGRQAPAAPPPPRGAGLGLVPQIKLYEAVLTITWGEEPNTRSAEFHTLRAANPDL